MKLKDGGREYTVGDANCAAGESIEGVGSPDAAQVGKENMNTTIQNLGDELHKAERWMIWLTGAIAFFGLCTVVVAALQWSAIKGQLGEMKSGGVDTHDLAVAAKKQANLEREQLEGTVAAVVWLEEPRVTPDPITGRPLLVMLLLNQENRVMARHVYLRFAVKTTSFPRI
jgi:hypothetical protein